MSFPNQNDLEILFAHVAYQFAEPFTARGTGLKFSEARSASEMEARIAGADVVVVSGLWKNELVEKAPRLRFIQSIGAGTDQFSREILKARGIRLASASGVNANAVAEHAMSLILSLSRQLHFLRDAQAAKHWRPMQGDRSIREDEVQGKTLLVVGLGRIGQRLAQLAKAFEMRVMATRRDPSAGKGAADTVHADAELDALIPQADFIALTCPLTPQTEKLIGAKQLAAMRPTAFLVNAARGRVVDEAALIAALQAGKIAGAAVDVTVEEPLSPSSPLWTMPHVIVTPHSAGETRRYEDRVIDFLIENVERLSRGQAELVNGVV
ncbi:MAG TPA: D-2-hydroxyacid dehydrogenase [Arenimonas sp.]|nr:D-2-hydroxyacid dehydrogenase [Arenimonas sp.]